MMLIPRKIADFALSMSMFEETEVFNILNSKHAAIPAAETMWRGLAAKSPGLFPRSPIFSNTVQEIATSLAMKSSERLFLNKWNDWMWRRHIKIWNLSVSRRYQLK